MPTTTFSARLKRDGNINRIKELVKRDFSAYDIQQCFKTAGIALTVRHGDIPLIANLDALERKALSAKAVKHYGAPQDGLDSAGA